MQEVAAARIHKGLTQSALAAKVAVPASTIANIERGGSASATVIAKLQRVLGVKFTVRSRSLESRLMSALWTRCFMRWCGRSAETNILNSFWRQ